MQSKLFSVFFYSPNRSIKFLSCYILKLISCREFTMKSLLVSLVLTLPVVHAGFWQISMTDRRNTQCHEDVAQLCNMCSGSYDVNMSLYSACCSRRYSAVRLCAISLGLDKQAVIKILRKQFKRPSLSSYV